MLDNEVVALSAGAVATCADRARRVSSVLKPGERLVVSTAPNDGGGAPPCWRAVVGIRCLRVHRPSSASYRSRDRVFSGRRSRAVRMALLVIRTLALLISVEVSGLAGFAAELVALNTDGAADCCSDGPLEKGGKECPPGCPNCHCSHGGLALPPAAATEFADAFDPAASVATGPTNANAPHAPILASVYRPPRSAAAFV